MECWCGGGGGEYGYSAARIWPLGELIDDVKGRTNVKQQAH